MTRIVPLALTLLASCAADSVVLLELGDAEIRDGQLPDATLADASPDAVAEDAGTRSCKSNGDCKSNELCSKESCGSTLGRCESKPFLCDGARGLVCGCDGVLYFSDCLRRQEAVSATIPLTFCQPKQCSSDDDCPGGAICGFLFERREECSVSDLRRGQCWAPPTTCSSDGFFSDAYVQCSGSDACVDACSAIRSGVPHYRVRSCTSPRM